MASRNLTKLLHIAQVSPIYFFADDLLIFGEASFAQAQVMEAVLAQFCSEFGKKVNQSKSKLFVFANSDQQLTHGLGEQFGIPLTSDLGTYLGVPSCMVEYALEHMGFWLIN